MEAAHTDAVIGALADQLSKAVHAAAIRVIRRVDIPAAPFLGGYWRRRKRHKGKRSGSHSTKQATATGF
jgi:hypothetical protein